jgi:hypothetical protein
MSTVTFDTLKFANRLKDAGVSSVQAEAEASAIAEALTTSDLSTKSDLTELKYDLLKWMFGIALAQVGLLVGILVKLL